MLCKYHKASKMTYQNICPKARRKLWFIRLPNAENRRVNIFEKLPKKTCDICNVKFWNKKQSRIMLNTLLVDCFQIPLLCLFCLAKASMDIGLDLIIKPMKCTIGWYICILSSITVSRHFFLTYYILLMHHDFLQKNKY